MTGLSSVLKNFLHKGDQPSTKTSTAQATSKSSPTTSTTSSSTSRLPDPPQVTEPQQAHLSNKQQANSTTPMSSTTPTGASASTQQQAESIVRRENEAKAKRDATVFDGLPEGITLGRKMGDGAFSNVFEASLRPSPAQLAIDPNLGKQVKVAIKCVRKYELNSSQVSLVPFSSRMRLPCDSNDSKSLNKSIGRHQSTIE